ncbi:MAG: hypothetical protein D6796_12270 [Caldilineae bacterium]|nr:MAG: hypothetical protein D6796_12270 [Caldilineae bacterium]
MSLFKKLAEIFSPSGKPEERGLPIYVRCQRCGEALTTRVDLRNDLSWQDDDTYFTRKVLIGSGRCFQQIEVRLHFDAARRLTDRQIRGGVFLTAEEFAAERNQS